MRRTDFERVPQNWEHNQGLGRPVLKLAAGGLAILFAIFLMFTIFGAGAGVVSTVVEEAGAQFERYQKFKDLAAALDAQRADIDIYIARLAEINIIPRADQDRHDKQEAAQVRAELTGVRAKYNKMAAQYNAAMAKINFRYANVGNMPAGADPLPREFRLYERGSQ